MNQDFKDEIYKAIFDITPKHVDKRIKEDICKIAIKIMECLEGESTLGTFISLHLLQSAYKEVLIENHPEIFGANNSFEKIMQSFSSESIH